MNLSSSNKERVKEREIVATSRGLLPCPSLEFSVLSIFSVKTHGLATVRFETTSIVLLAGEDRLRMRSQTKMYHIELLNRLITS